MGKKISNRQNQVITYLVICLANIVPFAMCACLYPICLWVDIFLFVPIAVGLSMLNFQLVENPFFLAVAQCEMALCARISGQIRIELYCAFISNDSMGRVLGEGLAQLEMVGVFLSAIVLFFVKLFLTRRKRRLETSE